MRNKEATLVRGLEAHGYHEISSKSKRYRMFERSSEPGIYMFVGFNGALRRGTTTTNAMSLSNSARYKTLMKAGDPSITMSN